MNLLKKLMRKWKHFKRTESLSVWTRDDNGRVFHYDIRIAPVRDYSRYLVKFVRTGPSNTVVVKRTMSPKEVHGLRMQSC